MKTIIIGAGAAGLAAAITAARHGGNVTILEKENKPGKKILVTGNGKCNITNTDLNESKYYGDRTFIKSVIETFGYNDTIKFFESCGIYTKDKNGYIYPHSEQASTVLNRLRDVALNLGVKIKTNNEIKKIEKTEEGFFIYAGIIMECDKIIIATGGMSMPKTGSNGSGYKFANDFGHFVVTPKPALTGLICQKDFLNKASGVRVYSKITLKSDDNILGLDKGELQITDYGISGIPVFNISRLAEENINIYLDFMPDISLEILKDMLTDIFNKCYFMSVISAMNGLFNEKLSEALLQKADILKSVMSENITEAEIKKLAETIKNYSMIVKSPRGFEYAQVTRGGVSTDEINPLTMESKIIKNLYFAGEIIDIDGICGGYNLQFAWATGAIAGGNCAK